MASVAVAYFAALLAAAILFTRHSALRDLGPAALIVLVQAVWFVVPSLARASGWLQTIEPLGSTYAAYAFGSPHESVGDLRA
jgi:hypothetical protein